MTNMLDVAAKGGPLMYILVAMSVAAVGLIVRRIIFLAKIRRLEEQFWQSTEESLLLGADINRLHNLCRNHKCPGATLTEKTLLLAERGHRNPEQALEAAAAVEVSRLEKDLGTLATLAATAPLVGFLGTVTGMVKVFMKLQGAGTGVDVNLLAGGIWEALITTVAGLGIAIVAIIFYNYFVDRVESIATNWQEKLPDLLMAVEPRHENTDR